MKFKFLLSLLPAVALAGPYNLTAIIPWQPANSRAVDISTINNGTYYLSDIENGVVHVIDVASTKENTQISGFVGVHRISGKYDRETSGPSGLVALPELNELYVADGNGTVKVVSLKTNTIISTINLNITYEADEIGYDATHQVVAVTAPAEDTPILFFISALTRQVIATIPFPSAINGIELPNWNTHDGLWYLSIPRTPTNPQGEIAIIDPITFKILKTLPEPPCNSAGTAFGAPHSHTIFLACTTYFSSNNTSSYIISTSSGKIVKEVKGVTGSDQVAYWKKKNLFFAAAARNLKGPELVVIDAARGRVLQRLTTDNGTAHAVAVDEGTGRVFVPLKTGIAVYDYKGN